MLQHDYIRCPWQPFKQELMVQWRRLKEEELQETGPNRRMLARLIAKKYGVAWQLVESYLANMETALMPRRAA